MPAGQGFLIVGLCDKHHADVPTHKPVIQQVAHLGHWHQLGQFFAKYPSLYNKAVGQFAHLWGDPVQPWLSPRDIGLAVGWVNATSVLRFSLPERAGAAVLQWSAPMLEDELTKWVCMAATHEKSREALERKYRTFFSRAEREYPKAGNPRINTVLLDRDCSSDRSRVSTRSKCSCTYWDSITVFA